MKKFLFPCLGAAALAMLLSPAATQAGLFSQCSPCGEVECCDPCDPCGTSCDDDCNPCDPCNPCDVVCNKKTSKWFLNGHLEAGFWANEYGQTNTYRPTGQNFSALQSRPNAFYGASGNTGLLQNVQHTGAQINQVYISAGKETDGKYGLDIGGKVDFTWGTDARYVQSAGLEKLSGHGASGWGSGDYYAAFAQAYGEIAYKKLKLTIGKFYAPFGGSAYTSPDNFFYSVSQTFYFVPATGGGAYATYFANDKLVLFLGACNPDEFGETKDDNVVLGGFALTASKRLSINYSFAAGERHYDGTMGGPGGADIFVNTLLLKYQVSKKLRTLIDWSYTQNRTVGNTTYIGGVNNEWVYQYTKKLGFGLRLGYVHGDYAVLSGGNPTQAPISTIFASSGNGRDDWYTISLGANWTPTKRLTLKPEVRYDCLTDGKAFNFVRNSGADAKSNQISGGMSAVVKF